MPEGRNFVEELWVGIRADLSHLQAGLTTASAQTKTFVGRLGAMSGQLRRVGKAIGLISTASAIMGGIATKVFADFEQGMANTASVLGSTQEELATVSDFAREMGRTTVFTATQAANAMYFLASAGFDAQKIMGSLKGTLALAAATQHDLAETTRIVVSAMNQFNLTAEESSRVANAMSAIISSTQATMDRLGDSLKFVGPIASGLNISLEQTLAVLGKLFNAGLQASQAGTSLRQALIRLQKPTAQSIKAIGDLGLTWADINPQTKDLVQIIRTLEKAEAGAIDKGDELAKIFGQRAIATFQILIREGADAIEDLEDKITGTNKAFEMAEIQINTLRGSFKLLLSALQEAAIQIGEVIAPIVRGMADTFRDAVQIFNTMPAIFKKVAVMAVVLATGLGLVVAPVMLLLSLIPSIVAGWGTLTALFGATLGPIALVTAGIIGLVTAIGLMISADRRAAQQRKDNIKSIDEMITKREHEILNINAMSSRYVELADRAKLTNKEQREMEKILGQLKLKYPDLIKDTKFYAGALDDVRRIADSTSKELQKLAEMKLSLEKVKITLDMADLKVQVQKLKDELKPLEKDSFKLGAEVILSSVTGGAVRVDNTELLETLSIFDDIKRVSVETMTGTTKMNTALLTNSLKENISELDTIKSITEDISKLTDGQIITSTEIEKIRAVATDEERSLTKIESGRIKTLEEQKNTYSEISSSLAGLVKDSTELNSKQIELLEIGNKLKAIGDSETVLKRKVTTEEDLGEATGGLAKEEIELERQKQDFMFQLEKQVLEARLSEKKLYVDESRKFAEEAIDAEFEYKQRVLEMEKEVVLRQAEDLKEDKAKVEKAFKAESISIEKARLDAHENLNRQYFEKLENFELEKMRREAFRDEEELAEYKAYLQEKFAAEKEGTDRYLKLLRLITEVEESEWDARMAKARYWGGMMTSLATSVGQAFGNQIATGMTSAWKGSLIAVINMLAKHYKNILAMGMINDLAHLNFGAAAMKAAAIGLISAAASAAKANIASAEIGAEVQAGGVVRVHPGETIVPAKVVRKTDDEYSEIFKEFKGIDRAKSVMEDIVSMSSVDKMFDAKKMSVIVDKIKGMSSNLKTVGIEDIKTTEKYSDIKHKENFRDVEKMTGIRDVKTDFQSKIEEINKTYKADERDTEIKKLEADYVTKIHEIKSKDKMSKSDDILKDVHRTVDVKLTDADKLSEILKRSEKFTEILKNAESFSDIKSILNITDIGTLDTEKIDISSAVGVEKSFENIKDKISSIDVFESTGLEKFVTVADSIRDVENIDIIFKETGLTKIMDSVRQVVSLKDSIKDELQTASVGFSLGESTSVSNIQELTRDISNVIEKFKITDETKSVVEGAKKSADSILNLTNVSDKMMWTKSVHDISKAAFENMKGTENTDLKSIKNTFEKISMDSFRTGIVESSFKFGTIKTMVDSIDRIVGGAPKSVETELIKKKSSEIRNIIDQSSFSNISENVISSIIGKSSEIVKSISTSQINQEDKNVVKKLSENINTVAVGESSLSRTNVVSEFITKSMSNVSNIMSSFNLIPQANIGARIAKEGIVNVHPGEIIVPAKVVRETESRYKEIVGGEKSSDKTVTKEIVRELIEGGIVDKQPINIYNPMVNDPEFWENIAEEYIIKAFERVKNR